MAIAPEQLRAARLAIPRLPLTAIFGFALFGVSGSIFLAYTSFSHSELNRAATPSNDGRVYEARAVPFDPPREDPAQRAASIARALTATPAEVQRAENAEPEAGTTNSQPVLLTESNLSLRGFSRFGNFAAANSYLAITGITFGFSAQSTPAGFMAADAETLTAAPVPEASTWVCGGALFLLVAARGARAQWHRKRRR